MLRSEHSIVRYDLQRHRVRPDRLHHGRDDDYLSAAKILLRLYRDGVGETRQSLHRSVETTLSRLRGCSPRRIAAFCKLLDDHSTYGGDKKAAVDLRHKVFTFGANVHPIVRNREGIFEHTVERARREIARALGMTWQEIDVAMFSDVIELQTLRSFDRSMEPSGLLSIYNVAQTQAAFYRATRVCIDAHDDFKTILRHAKLAGLMHAITPLRGNQPGYRIELDGPQSILRTSSRYGIRYAAMLPKLLTCRDWRLRAEVIGRAGQRFRLDLSPQDGLRSMLEPPDEYDSKFEREILNSWNQSPIEGWTFERETEFLFHHQTILTPDFVLRESSSNRKIYVEAIGYWTPEYLEEKCRRLASFVQSAPQSQWLLMFPKQRAAERQAVFAELPVRCVVFDNHCQPEQWVAASAQHLEQ